MKCSIEGCPGEYKERKIVHTVVRKGRVIVIDHVPAEVCTVRGDALLKPETVRRIETLLRTTTRRAGTVPQLLGSRTIQLLSATLDRGFLKRLNSSTRP